MSDFWPNVLIRIAAGLISILEAAVLNVGLVIWDLSLTLYNAIVPNRSPTRVVPDGYPGTNGLWPHYVSPKEDDSRCSCPMLNTMANHGILPHSGRDITFRELNTAIRTTFNFAPTFCFFVPHYAANFLGRSYWSDKFSLSDLDVHNCIEHDASLTREDSFFSRDQGKPSIKFVEELLAAGTGPGGNLTIPDLSRISKKRRAESKRRNPQFSLSTFHKLFGSANSSTILTIMGGRVEDLRAFLVEERFPDAWQPRIIHPMGLTLTSFQKTVLGVELGIKDDISSELLSALTANSGGASGQKKLA